jgi:hypothetical protein
MRKVAVAMVALGLVVGTGTAAVATESRVGTDARTLASAESRVVDLLDNFKNTASWKSAFKAAVATQNADLARLTTELGPRTTAVMVPSLINVRLDRAEAKLQADGLNYKTVGGGAFGIIITADWTVCSQHPGPGAHVTKGSSVELDVEKFGCS